MVGFQVAIVRGEKLPRKLRKAPEKIQAALATEMLICAVTITENVRRMAPVDTGAYRDSIDVKSFESTAHGAVVTIASSMPYGNRLEYGFSGTDSMGRVYRQPPRPHWRPAILHGRRLVDRRLGMMVREVWDEV